ncbi:MAG: mechanosensitive ion channel family protein [Planctomycetota bacterium]
MPSRRPSAPARTLRRLVFTLLISSLVHAFAQPAGAAPVLQDTAESLPAQSDGTSRESPRESLTNFLELCRAGDFATAARYLDVPEDRQADAPALARRLKAVLDRHVWFDLEVISNEPEGQLDDDLPADTEEVGSIPGESNTAEPVRMTLHASERGSDWVFSLATVSRTDEWFARLGHTWALEYLPEPLLRPGPADLLYWQWLALPCLLVLAWLAGLMLRRLTIGLFSRLTAHTAATWDDEIVLRLAGPITLLWTAAVFRLGMPWLELYAPAQEFIQALLRGALFAVFFWSVLRSVDVAVQVMLRSQWALRSPASRALLPLGGRLVKGLILIMAAIAILDDLGFPVTGLITGLGVGGLALALAAQETVKNLFGAFSIGMDETLRVGDDVTIDGATGTVESIGLRSTRIRTLDRTLITIPNGKLVEAQVESLTARDRFRLNTTLGLVYGTTEAQMRQVVAEIEQLLRAHPKIWPDTVIVAFKGFGESSLDVDVICWFQVESLPEFRTCRQDVLLAIMGIVERSGSDFAFPTRTVHLLSESKR